MVPASLNEIAATIADGAPVDWPAIEDAIDPAARGVIQQLRLVERITQAHASLPPAASFSESLRGSTLGVHDGAGTPTGVPTVWGPLTIIEKIGRGTFGEIYRARDPRLDRPVALKLLRRRERHADDIESHVIEEGRLAARVKHPNVVTVYGAERINGRVGLWMEFIDGRTLEEEMRERGPLPPREVAAIGVDLCRALQAIHRADLLHRDVKAQNVMRDGDGRVVLTDFGSGRDVSESTGASPELAGTPLYLAPEVLGGRPASTASDVYSLGVLLFYLVTGSFPVRGRSLADLREAHNRARTEVAARLSAIPAPLAGVLVRALAHDPSARFVNAVELEQALTARVLNPRHRWRVAAMAAAAIVAVAALTIFFGTRGARAGGDARLTFKPRDLVLIARFDNRTGEKIFDGAIEYALERELTASDIVGLVPRERVEDTLQLMKLPHDTIVDRAVGREVCLRDGHIKGLLSGRVEKFGATYVLTTELVDPADGSSVTTVSDEIVGQDGIVAGLHRQATAVRLALGEQRDRLRGADPKIEPGATRSLRAFQLYSQSYQLGRENHWAAALEVAQRVVVEDPDFASGWVWLAWATRNSEMGATPGGEESKIEAVRARYRPFLERALALVDSVPVWERYWIEGSCRSLLGDHEGAVPMYQALLKIRPDHYYGANNLVNELGRMKRPDEFLQARQLIANQRPNDLNANYQAASDSVGRGDFGGAKPFVDRVRQLLKGDPVANPVQTNAAAWLAMLPAYIAWNSGRVNEAWQQLQTIERESRVAPAPAPFGSAMTQHIGWFAVSLGRLHDAEATFDKLTAPTARHIMQFNVAAVAGNVGRMQEELRNVDSSARPARYIRAGLFDDARRAAAREPLSEPASLPDPAYRLIPRGYFALLAGNPEKAIAYVREGFNPLWNPGLLEHEIGCETLAAAFESLKRRDEAIVALESCVAERPKFLGDLITPFWMQLKLHLADTYRRSGRIDDAVKQEEEVRQLLVVADPDHPFLKRLNEVTRH